MIGLPDPLTAAGALSRDFSVKLESRVLIDASAATQMEQAAAAAAGLKLRLITVHITSGERWKLFSVMTTYLDRGPRTNLSSCITE